MLSKRILPAILAGIFFLSACVPGAATPTLAPATEAPTLKPTAADPYATYKNSFEEIADLTSSGITSNQNGITAEFQNAIRINKDIVHSGSQSLEAYDTPGSRKNPKISIDFPIHSLIGKNTIDLSNKMFHIDVFIPKSSPIQNVRFGCSRDATSVVIPINIGGGNDAPDVKGRWFSFDINIKMMFESNNFNWGQKGSEAKSILWDCDKLSLVGFRSKQGATAPASFMVDDLEWTDVPYTHDSIPVDMNAESLRKYADLHNLKIGSVLTEDQWLDGLEDPRYVQILAQEFNLVCSTNSSWPENQPASLSGMVFDYTQDDAVAKLFLGSHVSLKGATGGWHLQLPKWILDADFKALQPFLESRVEQDVSRYKGNMYMWDVFNETVADDGVRLRNRQQKGPSADLVPYGYQYSPWVDGNDTSLIRAAFVKARQSDPNAKLFLNDFDNDQFGQPKAETFYHYVADMKKDGVPIDGVGFQLHVWIKGNTVGTWSYRPDIKTYLDGVERTVKRYADIGLLVEFSEVEVGIRTDDIDLSTPTGQKTYERRLADQAEVYGGLAKIAVENKNVAAFIIWMVSDRYQQGAVAPGYGDTSLLDPEYQPKPAYYAIMNELKKP